MAELPSKISHIQVQAFGRGSGELTQPGHFAYSSDIEKTDVGQLSLNEILNWQR